MPYKDHQDRLNAQRSRRWRRWEFIRRYKAFCGCAACPERDPVCLDAHHVDPSDKDAEVYRLAASGASMERVKDELRKCMILCRNCHAKHHG